MAETSRTQAERAFLVQLDRLPSGTTGFDDDAVGRVEHIRSGESSRFGSVRELIEFMERVLDENAPSGSGETHA